jgi:hypothetical protein
VDERAGQCGGDAEQCGEREEPVHDRERIVSGDGAALVRGRVMPE